MEEEAEDVKVLVDTGGINLDQNEEVEEGIVGIARRRGASISSK